MTITDRAAVFFHYTLTNDAGDIVDSSDGGEPLGYLHGSGTIVPGLERELTGKNIGDEFNVVVAPRDGYGERSDDLVRVVPRDAFPNPDTIERGMQFHTETPAGPQMLTVTEVKGRQITVDANHPLAGVTLNFHIEVTEVRKATKDELAHGHIHGPGCSHHH